MSLSRHSLTSNIKTSGAVRLQCESNECVTKLNQIANGKFSEKYSIKVSNKFNPRLQLIGMSMNY